MHLRARRSLTVVVAALRERARMARGMAAILVALAAACGPGQAGPADGRSDAADANSSSDGQTVLLCELPTQTRCGDGPGTCVDLQSDPNHCGECGVVCPGGGSASGRCVAGQCELMCAAGRANCNASGDDLCEVELLTSPASCGGCGLSCGEVDHATPRCDTGVCTPACNTGYGDCDDFYDDGCEANTNSDLEHCGACDMQCPWPSRSTLQCTDGLCGFTCRHAYADCDRVAANGCEVALISATNCGACGRACNAATRYCADTGAEISCVSICPSDTTDCDFACIRTDRDPDHCGACNHRCPDAPNAQASCTAGQCTLECRPGYADCDGLAENGCETNLSTSAQHCGACGNTCPGSPTSPALCAAGVCRVRCAPGTLDCDRNGATGCEVSALTDPRNCGSCGRACPTVAAANATCSTGVCSFVCERGFANCNRMAADGCETATENNPLHCGACNRRCPSGQNCVAGACRNTGCPSGRAECDGRPETSCETDVLTSNAHCGACGLACARPNSNASCVGGGCVLTSCLAGFGNCDNDARNGCETDLRTVSNCGACGGACAFANATAQCGPSGACALGTCAPGYANCDANANNGCETDTRVSTRHCGVCGRACGTGQSCVAGVCQGPSIDGGVADAATGDASPDATMVDASDADARTDAAGFDAAEAGTGCLAGETLCGSPASCTDVASDPTNCGACGTVCPIGTACVGGSCRCPAGQTLCDGTCTSVLADPMNCGACGTRCGAGMTCQAGRCRCPAGLTQCGTACVDTRTDRSNCGSCGVTCPGAQVCAGGTCGLTCGTILTACGSGASMTCADLRTDVNNCGACGNRCPATLPGATSVSCVAGRCTPTCGANRGDCDSNPSNGCEAALATDSLNCGACGTVCAGGRVCSAAACACPTGQMLCGGVCVNTSTSMSNCGACGAVCPAMPPHAGAAMCTGSICRFTCNSGYGNCDAMNANGCETPLNTVSNCGACGTVCSPTRPNAMGASCVASQCRPQCAMGFGDCDMLEPNGCEENLQTSTNHCGMCGLRCSTGQSCVAGACVLTIDPPRHVFPLSGGVVAARRPTFRWVLPTGATGAEVEICANAACGSSLTRFTITGSGGVAPSDLPMNMPLYWRLRSRNAFGTSTLASAPWPLRTTPGTNTATVIDLVNDFNGDGRADLVVGWPVNGSGAVSYSLDTGSTMNIRRTATLGGPSVGTSVATNTDVDGDGLTDVIVGEPDANRVYVLYGAAATNALVLGRTITLAATSRFGAAVSGIGDFDGDGYGDFIVGSPTPGTGTTTSRADIFFGAPRTAPSLATQNVSTSGASSLLGATVAYAGDFNRDGLSDAIVGYGAGAAVEGFVLVVPGSAARAINAQYIAAPIASAGWGQMVSSAGDIDGDGYGDVLIGAPLGAVTGTVGAGRAFVYYGSSSLSLSVAPTTELTGAPVTNGGLGVSGTVVGDTNGDGCTEIAVGSKQPGNSVYFYVAPRARPATLAFHMSSPLRSFGSLTMVAGPGDATGDGIPDLLVGVPTMNRFVLYRGAAGALGAVHWTYTETGAGFGVSVAERWTPPAWLRSNGRTSAGLAHRAPRF